LHDVQKSDAGTIDASYANGFGQSGVGIFTSVHRNKNARLHRLISPGAGRLRSVSQTSTERPGNGLRGALIDAGSELCRRRSAMAARSNVTD
jgi:hypothetical protein